MQTLTKKKAYLVMIKNIHKSRGEVLIIHMEMFIIKYCCMMNNTLIKQLPKA